MCSPAKRSDFKSLLVDVTPFQGAMYTYPSDPRRWRLPLGLGTTHCGILSCIDEAVIAYVVTFLSKKCFMEYDFMFE